MKADPEISEDEFYTVKNEAIFETKVKNSRFIGRVNPVKNKKEAEEYIKDIQKLFHDASHHCFAYRIGPGTKSIFRFGDDGEPSGTAGKPILSVIDSYGFVNLCVVVTRYFGGKKLGTGGLARAYSNCANHTLQNAKRILKYLTGKVKLIFDFAKTKSIMNVIDRFGGKIISQKYENEITLTVIIRSSDISRFKNQLIDSTSGNILILEA